VQHHVNSVVAEVNTKSVTSEHMYAVSNLRIILSTAAYTGSQAVPQHLFAINPSMSIHITALFHVIVASQNGEPRRFMLSTVIQRLWTQYIHVHQLSVPHHKRTRCLVD